MKDNEPTKRSAVVRAAMTHALGSARGHMLVLGLIIAFGAMQFSFFERAADFVGDDVFFADAARSLLHHGIYGINGNAEGNLPPGLSAILALLCAAGACSRAAFLHAMAVFQTLAFVATYLLLRRLSARAVAVAITLLLISSQPYFAAATQLLYPNHPYFFTSIGALYLVLALEDARTPRTRAAWAAALALLCAASLLFATAGIALLGAISARIAVLLYRKRRQTLGTAIALAVPTLLGVMVQLAWSHHGRAPLEWPIAGYPRPYLAQLLVKQGNYPELGMASWHDIPARIAGNAFVYSAFLVELLLRHWVDSSWISVAVLGPLLLIFLGWVASMRRDAAAHDWYFGGYSLMYLLWPWAFVPRFFLPVAPLACLYLWRGILALRSLATRAARPLGLVWLPLSLVLAVLAWLHSRRPADFVSSAHFGIQGKVSSVVWLGSAFLAAWMVWAGSDWRPRMRLAPFESEFSRRLTSLLPSAPRALGGVAIVGLIGLGVAQQLDTGRINLDLKSEVNSPPADARAASWIAAHSDSTAVIMARHVPLAFHYARRKVVWFPPSSDARLLMQGIRRLKVDYVIVVHRRFSFYLPPDDACFAPLVAAFPNAFRLLVDDPGFRIFAVTHDEQATEPLGDRRLAHAAAITRR